MSEKIVGSNGDTKDTDEGRPFYPPHIVTEQQRKKYDHRRRAGIKTIDRLNTFFGKYLIPDLKGKLSREYAAQRGSQSSARRELEVLQAAVNYYVEDEVGGVQTKFRSWLPDPSPARALADALASRRTHLGGVAVAGRSRQRQGPLHEQAYRPVHSGRALHRHPRKRDLRCRADAGYRSRLCRP